jgi:hypothetical protein
MIPVVALIRVGSRRLAWIPIPLVLVWLLLLPFCLLLLPLFVIGCRANGVRAGASLVGIWRVLNGCRGLHLDVRHGQVALAVRLV